MDGEIRMTTVNTEMLAPLSPDGCYWIVCKLWWVVLKIFFYPFFSVVKLKKKDFSSFINDVIKFKQ